jgi:hypothetical protein
MVMVVSLLGLAAPGGAGATSPAADVVPQIWLIGTPNTAPVHAALVIREAANHVADPTVEFTVIGLRPEKHHFIVLSAQSCAEDFVLGFPYGFASNSRGQRSAAYRVHFEDILITSLRSVRILRGISVGAAQEITCGKLRAYDKVDQVAGTTGLRARASGTAAALGIATSLPVDVNVTIFREPTAKGIIVAGQSGDDAIRVRAVVTGPADGGPYPSRWTFIVGVAGCGQPWSTSERAGRIWVDIDRTGSGWVNRTTPLLVRVATGDVNGDGIVDAADYLVWRIKLANGRSIGCYEADALLARHQS